MAFTMQRRPSSWFGPQFTLQSFSIPTLGSFSSSRPSISSRGSYAEPRRSSNLKPSLQKLPMPELEPLFHDSYLSSLEDISPTTPDPKISCLWGNQFNLEYIAPSETLEDFGLALDDDECNIIATYISIVNVGKPKVIDIPPPQNLSIEQSPQPQAKNTMRPPIVWRMPSYDSTTRTSEMGYPMSERAESFDSRSSDPSSFSEGPKTPTSFSESLKVMENPLVDPSCFPEPPSRGSITRSSTLLRRHSRNLSASFSKAFLNRVKDSESTPPPSRPTSFICESTINYSLPYSATRRPQTPDAFGNSAELPRPSRPQHLAPITRQAPVLRRKKSIVGIWF